MYEPKRDSRFDYLWDVMHFVEEMQCKGCAFSKLQDDEGDPEHAANYPMCHEIEAKFVLEEPVEELDDAGRDGVVCTLFKSVETAKQEHPDQQRLI